MSRAFACRFLDSLERLFLLGADAPHDLVRKPTAASVESSGKAARTIFRTRPMGLGPEEPVALPAKVRAEIS